MCQPFESKLQPIKSMKTAAVLKSLICFIAIGFSLTVARAASVTLTNADAAGATVLTASFTSKGFWNTNTAPNAANDYFTGAFGMRTPQDTTNYTFQGNSLTLQPPTTTTYSIIYKGTAAVSSNQTYTINNLTNAGGLIRSGGATGSVNFSF